MARVRTLLALSLLALACAAGSSEDATISPDALAERISGATAPLVLDVRTSNEFASGHVPGAVNVPHTELSSRLAELGDARDREVVVYCERGGRAALAEQLLREAGFRSVLHLEGDMSAWRARDDLPCQGC